MSSSPYRKSAASEPCPDHGESTAAKMGDSDLVPAYALLWLGSAAQVVGAVLSGRVLRGVDVLAGMALVLLPLSLVGRPIKKS